MSILSNLKNKLKADGVSLRQMLASADKTITPEVLSLMHQMYAKFVVIEDNVNQMTEEMTQQNMVLMQLTLPLLFEFDQDLNKLVELGN